MLKKSIVERAKNYYRTLSATLVFIFIAEIILGVLLPVRLPFEDKKPSAVAAGESWYSAAWLYRKAITMSADTTIVSSTQSNFPVLVSITDTGLRDRAQADGDDILFTSSDGATKLSHEIESFTSSTGALTAWVKVPSLAAGTVIYLYYGNSAATNQQSVTSTWSNSFIMVQHMTSTDFRDVTVNGIHGTNYGTTISSTGKIGSAAAFVSASNNSHDYGTSTTTLPGDITFSAWVKAVSFVNPYNSVVSRESESTNGDYTLLIKNDNKMAVYVRDNSNTDIHYDGDGAVSVAADAWYYVSFTYAAGGSLIGYVNTTTDKIVSAGGTIAGNANNKSVLVGKSYYAARTWNGLIDEIHISSVARSASWIATEYNNQSSPATFYTVGSEEIVGTGLHFEVTGTATQTAAVAQTVTVTLKNDSSATVTGYTGSHNVILSGPSATLNNVSPTAGGVTFGATTSLIFANGVATTSVVLYRAESTSLDLYDVTSTAYSSTSSAAYDLDVVVSAGTFSQFVFDSPAAATSGVAFSMQSSVTDNWLNYATSTLSEATAVTVSTGTISVTSIPVSSYISGGGTITTSTIISAVTERPSVVLTFTSGAIISTTSIMVTGTPNVPSGMAVARTSDTSYTISWTDNSSVESGVAVERAVDSGSGFGSFTTFVTTTANATSTIDTGTLANRRYQWRLRATNGAGNSSYISDNVTHYTTPSAPATIAATRVSDSEFTVVFTTSSLITATSTVERCSGSGCDSNTFTAISGSPTTGVSLSDTATAANNRYKWRVAAVSGLPESVTSTYATSSFEYTTPTAPSGLSATFVSDSQIDLSWTDNSAYEDGFSVESSEDGGAYSRVSAVTTTVSAGVTTYSYTGSGANHIYQFKVRAHVPTTTANATDLFSAYATSGTVTTTPAAPTGATATFVSSTQINLTWSDASSYETNFGVERAVDTGGGFGSFSGFTTSSAGVVAASDTTVSADRRYQYRIRALGTNGNSAYSTSAVVTTTPIAPTIGVATSTTSTAMVFAWTDNSTFESSFSITFVTGSTTVVTGIAANSVTTSVSGLTPNTQYAATVAAVSPSSAATSSASAAMYTLAAIPSAPTFGTVARTSLPLTINVNGNPTTTEFTIYNVTDGVYVAASGASNSLTAVWQTNSVWGENFAVTGLTCNTSYSFVVRAKNGLGVLTASSTSGTATTAACSGGGGGFSPALVSVPSIADPETTRPLPPPTPVIPLVVPKLPTSTTQSPATTIPITSTPAVPATQKPTAVVPKTSPVFTKERIIGSTGEDIKMLQRYFNTHGFIVAKKGPGSFGLETNRFGAATYNATRRFQQANKLKVTGRLDAPTRKLLNSRVAAPQVQGVKIAPLPAKQKK